MRGKRKLSEFEEFGIFIRFLSFIIGLEWRIKAWGLIPMILWAFWELSAFWTNVRPWTPYSLRESFTKY